MNQTLSKFLALTMAVLIVFTLAACQGGTTTTTTGSTTGATTTKATTDHRIINDFFMPTSCSPYQMLLAKKYFSQRL